MNAFFIGNLPKRLALFILGIPLLFNAACAPTEALPPSALPAVTLLNDVATSEPSPTIVWFPATRTPTPFLVAEATSTPQMLPGLGRETYSDDFSTPENWSNLKSQSDGGNAALLNRKRLTLAINAAPAYLASLNTELLLTDFYVETSVQVNRCQGEDTYGMLFRAAAEFFAYRYILNCKGEARVERMRNTEIAVLQEWVPSGDAPFGAPGEVKMAIWVSGVEMRFFLNGRHQFRVLDKFFNNGGLGLFAATSNPLGMNVSFSDLAVYSVDYVSPTPTFTPTRTPTPSRTPRP